MIISGASVIYKTELEGLGDIGFLQREMIRILNRISRNLEGNA